MSGFTNPKTGPMTIPTRTSSNTSGTRLLLNKAEKRCAQKINAPKKINVVPNGKWFRV